MNKKGQSTINKYKQILTVKNYSTRTIEIYVHYVKVFIAAHKTNIYHLNEKDVQKFFLNYNYTSISQQNQFISSVKLLFKYVVRKSLKGVDLERPRKERKLPQIIDKEVLRSKILTIKNTKHKAILSLAYSCGLRVSEVINLKIKDIDSDRMILNIRQAKGNKDRIVPLSIGLLKILREYFTYFNPKIYLFNGQFKLKYSSTSCNKIVKKYIRSDAHIHQLRHSCFTHLVENGTNLRVIQSIAGHKSSKTTEIYTHVSNDILKTITMPI